VFRSGAEGVRVSGDTVFVSAWHSLDDSGMRAEPWLVALDRVTGRELWRAVLPVFSGGVVVNGAPALYQDLVLVAARGGRLWAIDRTTRRVAWQFTPATRQATDAQPEVYGDVMYHDGGDNNLYALSAADGAVRWRAPMRGTTLADLLVTERRVYATDGLRLYIFDRQTGRPVVRVTQPRKGEGEGHFASPAAFADGQVFILVTGAAWSFDEP
jgi:outer membrane protein assembly factor BamB